MNYKNLGKINISIDSVNYRPEEVAEIFAKIKAVPIKCEMDHYKEYYKYTLIAEPFAEIKDGELVPEYKLTIIRRKGKVVSVTASKEQEIDCTYYIDLTY